MPGHKDVSPVEPLKSGLKCLECKLLLKDPVQTEEGDRLCRSCYEEIKSSGISKGGIKLGGEEESCYPDRAVEKEIQQLLVKCYNHATGCTWQGKLKDLENHSEDCKFRPQPCSNKGCSEIVARSEIKNHEKNTCPFRRVSCQYCKKKTVAHQLQGHYERECTEYPILCERCNASVRKSKLEEHHQKHCPYVQCICGDKVRRVDLEAHYNEKGAISRHIQALQELYHAVLKSHEHLCVKLERNMSSEAASSQREDIGEVRKDLKACKSELDDRLLLLEQKLGALEPLGKEVASSLRESASLQRSQRELKEKVEGQEEKLKQVTAAQARPISSAGSARYTEGYMADSRIAILERKLEDVERHNSTLRVHISELELQLQASLASTHNGSFLWRIPDIERRRRDAQEERITSIYSPPFYTGRNGYKMCIRAYLNGDGIGFKTHLSLFFVLMRGEYDPLLKWPFEHKVSLILVDQEHRKHIVQTFKPTPESSSFKRPTSEMNVASGCPQFSKIDVLEQDNYVKEDIMYIKCIVDVSRIFHP